MKPTFFESPPAFRRWLEKNHKSVRELWVGFYKRSSGKPSITWPEAVDQLLCYGWIDGVRKSLDETRYVIRVTPRRPGSTWSAVNVKRCRKLLRLELMHEAGLKAFKARKPERTNRYSFERKHAAFDRGQERAFRRRPRAWEFFQSQPPWYRRTATWWVISAKQDATRKRRLEALILDSASGHRIGSLRRDKKP